MAVVHIIEFSEIDTTMEYRIGGWIERGLEMNGCKKLSVKITRSLTRFDPFTEYRIDWG